MLAFFAMQLRAALFGLLILAGLIVSAVIWQDEWALARYDALVLWAVGLQIAFLVFGLETWDEARVILAFHITGTVMEWFKVSQGSWSYPEASLLKVYGVPLFTGFMYASVGSYIARIVRLYDLRFTPMPPIWCCAILAVAIYGNFWLNMVWHDIRMVLFPATLILFSRSFVVDGVRRLWLPLAVLLASGGLWVAENVGTFTGTWAYGTAPRLVSLSKMGSWYLLLWVAFFTVILASPNARARVETRALLPYLRGDRHRRTK